MKRQHNDIPVGRFFSDTPSEKDLQHLLSVFLTARARLATAPVRVVWGVQTACRSIKQMKIQILLSVVGHSTCKTSYLKCKTRWLRLKHNRFKDSDFVR